MQQHDLSTAALDRHIDSNDQALVDTVHDIASQAYAHLQKAR